MPIGYHTGCFPQSRRTSGATPSVEGFIIVLLCLLPMLSTCARVPRYGRLKLHTLPCCGIAALVAVNYLIGG
ncbi:hypothetical protein LIA77_01868 [Sarocladium implicatum]|nr:hypothetical protein LIA77_01868 [Sarocladium implicatum]